MPEFSFSNKKNDSSSSSSTLLSRFFHFCFSFISHPLYFSYFIFFSPYLLSLLSFLSPLFITITLLLLALLSTVSHNLVPDKDDSEFSQSKLGFLLSVFQSRTERVSSHDEGIGYVGEFQAYLDMFQAQIFEVLEPKSEENCSESEVHEAPEEGRDLVGPMEEPNVTLDENPIGKDDKVEADTPSAEVKSLESLFHENTELEDMFPKSEEICSEGFEGRDRVGTVERLEVSLDENPVGENGKVEADRPMAEVKSLESLFHENTELEDLFCQKAEDKEVKPLDPESNKAAEEGKSEEKLALRSGSNAEESSSNSDGEYSEVQENLGSPESKWEYTGKSFGSYGSMRKEKEWRRTLACKLYEERHNVGGSEGMDLLWETYETEPNKVQEKGKTENGKKGDNHSEEEEEEDMDGKLCCLQALKFSAGKMNLGMGRPNLVKISKALKGIGWLHHVRRHGRKG